MSEVTLKGNTLRIGAAASLQALAESAGLQPALYDAIARDAELAASQLALPQLLAASGGSLLAAAMLALDAELELQDGAAQSYGNWLALRATAGEPAVAALSFSTAARLESFVADGAWLVLARWPAGRTRVAIGGWGSAPLLAMDGREASGILEAAENTLMLAGTGLPEDEPRLVVVRELAEQAQASIAA
ncbi:MAG: hypothetical protein KIT08_09180 [Anaerolineales bacterium]|nr:MAG: hypothetical protein KIT08_09180 [Anaerolineales bacterium]